MCSNVFYGEISRNSSSGINYINHDAGTASLGYPEDNQEPLFWYGHYQDVATRQVTADLPKRSPGYTSW